MKEYKSRLEKIELKRKKTDYQRIKVECSKDSETYIRQFWQDDISIYESFFLLLLNRANNTIGYVKISQGGICGTVVDVPIIAKYAIESLASSVILAHNHPSGNLRESREDVAITEKIKAALELFGIKVLDHLILTEESYTSFADNGLL